MEISQLKPIMVQRLGECSGPIPIGSHESASSWTPLVLFSNMFQ